jgi:hypothetical protein
VLARLLSSSAPSIARTQPFWSLSAGRVAAPSVHRITWPTVITVAWSRATSGSCCVWASDAPVRYPVRRALRLLRPRRLDAPLLRGHCLSGGVRPSVHSGPVRDSGECHRPGPPRKGRQAAGDRDLPWQRAILGSLTRIVYPRPAQREIELWRVTKGSRELRCVALYLPTGIDLRLMEGEDFRRTQLLRDGPAVQELANEWRGKLRASARNELGAEVGARHSRSSTLRLWPRRDHRPC